MPKARLDKEFLIWHHPGTSLEEVLKVDRLAPYVDTIRQ